MFISSTTSRVLGAMPSSSSSLLGIGSGMGLISKATLLTISAIAINAMQNAPKAEAGPVTGTACMAACMASAGAATGGGMMAFAASRCAALCAAAFAAPTP